MPCHNPRIASHKPSRTCISHGLNKCRGSDSCPCGCISPASVYANCKLLRHIFPLILWRRGIRYEGNGHRQHTNQIHSPPLSADAGQGIICNILTPSSPFCPSDFHGTSRPTHRKYNETKQTETKARNAQPEQPTQNAPTTVTWYPFSLRRLAMCEPMNPAPPPTQTLAPSPGGKVKGLWSGIFVLFVGCVSSVD